jgi:hypothetical protein
MDLCADLRWVDNERPSFDADPTDMIEDFLLDVRGSIHAGVEKLPLCSCHSPKAASDSSMDSYSDSEHSSSSRWSSDKSCPCSLAGKGVSIGPKPGMVFELLGRLAAGFTGCDC